jgi:hypothetical protein
MPVQHAGTALPGGASPGQTMQLVDVLTPLKPSPPMKANPMLQQAACIPEGMFGIAQLPRSASGCEHPSSFQPVGYALASSKYPNGWKHP